MCFYFGIEYYQVYYLNLFSDIDNITEQYLHVAVYDSDRDRVPGFKTVVQEKRGFSQ